MNGDQLSEHHLKKYYDTVYFKTAFEGDLKRVDRLKVLFEETPSEKRILSVGCGPGVDLTFLLESNEVYGVDISAKAVAVAGNLGIEASRGNVEEGLQYQDLFFDLVICTDLLEHLYNPKLVLSEIHRVLKSDGYALVSVPNHFIWYMRIRILLGKGIVFPYHRSNPWNYFHIRFFTLQTFLHLVRLSGFDVAETYYDAFFLRNHILRPVKRTLARRIPSIFAPHFALKLSKR